MNEFGAKITKPAEMWEQLLAIDINPVVYEIGRVINATFGKAIETAFDSRLGFRVCVNGMVRPASGLRLLTWTSGTQMIPCLFRLSGVEITNELAPLR